MKIKVPNIILSAFHLELTLKHIKDLRPFCHRIWISTKAVAISTVTHKLLSGYILSLPRFDEGSGILI